MAWLYKQPGSAKWWLGYRANGRQVLRSTGTADRKEAEKELGKVETMFRVHRTGNLTQELYELLSGKTAPKKSLHAEVEDWLNECTGTTAKGTLARYKGIVEDFKGHVHATPHGPMLSEITTDDVRGYLTGKLKRASVSTVNLERKILSGLFLRAVRLGTIQKNPVAPIKKFKKTGDEVERRNLTLDEINLAYSKAASDFWRYMILGGFYSGLREGDLITLDWRRVDWQRHALAVKARKTGKTVLVPIASRLAIELKAIHDARGNPKTGPLFPEESARYKKRGASSFSRQFYKILSDCKLVEKRKKDETKDGKAARRVVNEVTFHSLRHSFVTALNSTGTTNMVAKELAGHNSDVVNAVYTHLDFDLIMKAVAALPEVAM